MKQNITFVHTKKIIKETEYIYQRYTICVHVLRIKYIQSGISFIRFRFNYVIECNYTFTLGRYNIILCKFHDGSSSLKYFAFWSLAMLSCAKGPEDNKSHQNRTTRAINVYNNKYKLINII